MRRSPFVWPDPVLIGVAEGAAARDCATGLDVTVSTHTWRGEIAHNGRTPGFSLAARASDQTRNKGAPHRFGTAVVACCAGRARDAAAHIRRGGRCRAAGRGPGRPD